MRVADDPDVAGLLTLEDAVAFAGRLGVAAERQDLPMLRALLRAYLGRIPFQNLTMLARPRRPPTLEQIATDVLSGRGGPCGTLNPFFAALLFRLGYDVWLVSGSMQQPHCHLALMVRVAGQDYWLDTGNGHPYLEPIPLGDDEPRQFPSLAIRLCAHAPTHYALEHQFSPGSAWKTSYTFCTTPRSFRFFAGIIERHYTDPAFGPFLAGLRVIRCPQGALHALRDRCLFVGRDAVHKRDLSNRSDLFLAMQEFFGDLDLPVREALDQLEEAGIHLFGLE